MIISIVRRPEGLFTLQVTGQTTFAVPDKKASLDNKRKLNESFNLITTNDEIDFLRLQKSLKIINAVEKPSAKVLAATLDILVNTVADSSAFLNKPFIPFLSSDIDETSRSASNPRGFKGTKYKPPKNKSPDKKNLLPYLDGSHNESSVLKSMSDYLDEALTISDNNEANGSMVKNNGINNLRPFGQAFPNGMINQIALLPKTFHKYFTWTLRGMGESQIGHMINCYWAFDLEKNDQLRLIIAMMIIESPSDNCIQWILSMEATSSLRRNCLAEILLETGTFQLAFKDRHSLVDRLDGLCSDENFRTL